MINNGGRRIQKIRIRLKMIILPIETMKYLKTTTKVSYVDRLGLVGNPYGIRLMYGNKSNLYTVEGSDVMY